MKYLPSYRNSPNTDLIDYRGIEVQLLWQMLLFFFFQGGLENVLPNTFIYLFLRRKRKEPLAMR